MIVVRLMGGLMAYVSGGKWTCEDEKMRVRLQNMPMLATGYFITEDDKLASNSVEVFGGERVRGTQQVIKTDAPSGAVY